MPRIALTATADDLTRADIITRLQLEDARVFISSFDRPNIRYGVVEKDDARKQLLRFIQDEHDSDAGIVYCQSRKKVEETAAWLNDEGISALPYHAGLDAAVRKKHQDRFLREEAVRVHVGKIAWWGKVSDVLPDLRATFVMLVFATFSMQMYRTTLQGMLPLYAGVELGFSAAQVGSLFGVSGLFVLLMILPAGFITDRVGRKYASVPSTALPGIAFLALPFASTLPQLVVIMVLIGLAQGMSLGALSVSTYDVIPDSARGRLQGLRRTVGESGAVMGPLLGGWLVGLVSAGRTFLFYAPVLLGAAAALALVAKETLVRK